MNEHTVDEKKAAKIAKFEGRMAVVERDNPDLAVACRGVHSQLDLARTVAESIFNDDTADQPEVVMSISSMIADELSDLKDDKADAEDRAREDAEDGDGGLA
jgi:hypothetical protein